MAEKRGQGCRDVPHRDLPVRGDPPPDPAVSDPQLSRTRIRQRWEFASVLNFLHVFEPLIGGDLRISAEEIETALITPNDDLARLHVALLKGIPPVNRNMTDGDAWVTVVCKKLAPWWPWVAEGENPIKVDHGKEIQRYKALDPITRMMIMKALCEVRVQQDDVLRYITDELKKGTKITTFRKERIGGVDNGVSYWHDGDPIIGHRLYKEVVQVESKLKPRGKGRAAETTNAYQWETLATELEEFQKISDNLSSSKSNAEAVLGEMIKTEIVPVLQELQKKKERALKRQQREVLQLNGFLNYNRVGVTRSCRERKPVRYTFDDYDRSIDEAIHISKKLKTTGLKKDNVVQVKPVTNQNDALGGRGKDDKEDSEADDIHESLADVEDDEHQSDNNEDGDSHEKDENSKHQSDSDEDGHYDEKDENSKHQSDDGDDDEDGDYDEKDENSEHHSENDSDYDSDEKDEDHGENKIENNDYFTSSDADEESPKVTRNQKNAKTKVAMGIRRSKRFVEPTKSPAQMKKRLRQRPTRNSAQIVSDSEDDSSPDTKKQTEIVSDTETEGSAACDESQEDSGDASNE